MGFRYYGFCDVGVGHCEDSGFVIPGVCRYRVVRVEGVFGGLREFRYFILEDMWTLGLVVQAILVYGFFRYG